MSAPPSDPVAPWEFEVRVRIPITATDPGIERLPFDVLHTPEDGRGREIGGGCAYTVDLLRVSSVDLDAVSGDLSTIGEVITSDAFEERWEPSFPLLILDSLELRREWRGRGLGRVILARLIAAIGSATELVVIYPAPISGGVPNAAIPSKRDRAVDRLAAYWAPLGFVPYSGGVHVLDLRTDVADKALATVVASHEDRETV